LAAELGARFSYAAEVRFGPLFAAAALALAVGGCGGAHSRSATAAGVGFEGAALPAGVRAPGFTLSDQHGRRVSLSAYRGRVVALAFVSASGCRACVLVAQQLRGALDELGSAAGGVRAVFVTVAPRADTPAHVGGFLRAASLAGRAAYLTGTTAALEGVWRAYAVAVPRARTHARARGAAAGAPTTPAEAATTVLLIDRTGAERVVFGLEQITPEGLSHDIRLLLGG
jgi:protein SCO1